MSDVKIRRFIKELAGERQMSHARNPWNYSHPGNEVRRNNLSAYLKKMRELKPSVLLVGEAPGYRGCARVGIPFSSEKLLLSHPFFAEGFGVEDPGTPVGEASASIVWKTFDALNFYPLMWAAYPYHPHQPRNVLSNRAPRPEEIALGRPHLERLMDIYDIRTVVAVGRVAERTLTDMGVTAHPVRHPSHGGAVLFAKGLRDLQRRFA